MLFGNAVCKHRKIILIIALILLIPAILGMNATRINYDILVYLPEILKQFKEKKSYQKILIWEAFLLLY